MKANAGENSYTAQFAMRYCVSHPVNIPFAGVAAPSQPVRLFKYCPNGEAFGCPFSQPIVKSSYSSAAPSYQPLWRLLDSINRFIAWFTFHLTLIYMPTPMKRWLQLFHTFSFLSSELPTSYHQHHLSLCQTTEATASFATKWTTPTTSYTAWHSILAS